MSGRDLASAFFFGMKSAILFFDIPSACGGGLPLWDDWASPGVFKNGWIGLYGSCSMEYGIIAMELVPYIVIKG